MNGLVLLPLVPVRAVNTETSEMTTQLLYGELIEIIEIQGNWIYVRNLADNYKGWVDTKMIKQIDNEMFVYLNNSSPAIVRVPFIECVDEDSKEKFLLPGGSKLYVSNQIKTINDSKTFTYNSDGVHPVAELTGNSILKVARQYLSSPYLWGGKSVLGIDCSGFTQVVFSICGFALPRDADMQATEGVIVDFLEEVKAGDLAFFGNDDGEILHVGIMINSSQIIHASGWVKIESIDTHGIISCITGEYTHQLRVIKRYINS